MTTKLVPYKNASQTARALSRALGIRRVRQELISTIRPNDFVINWGNSRVSFNNGLNHGHAVRDAGNKLATFKVLQSKGVSIPLFTTVKNDAIKWLEEGKKVVARTLLTAHSGRGAEIVTEAQTLPEAPLYVQYKRKKQEFRVHVFTGKVVDIQEKRRRHGAQDQANYDPYIRSHNKGWVFCRTGLEETPFRSRLADVAIQAVDALGLDFGGADIIYNGHEDKFYVLEINTAPGLEGTTFEIYVNALKEYV